MRTSGEGLLFLVAFTCEGATESEGIEHPQENTTSFLVPTLLPLDGEGADGSCLALPDDSVHAATLRHTL